MPEGAAGPLRRLVLVVALLAIWQLVSVLGPWTAGKFPGPSRVAPELARLLEGALLWDAIARTLLRLFAGYGLSLIVGIPLGLLLGRSRLADELLGTPVLGLQALPSICWLPIAVLWFGESGLAVLFVVVAGSVFSVALAAQSGVRNLDPIWIRAARTLGARGLRLTTTVLLSASLPALISGARLGWAFAWRSLMAAELLQDSGGLGQLLQRGRDAKDAPMLFAVMTVIVVLGLGFERALFAPLERAVRRRFGTEAPS